MTKEDFTYRPDLSDAGQKSKESNSAKFTWFSPVDEPEARFRYAIIKEEKSLLQIMPAEGRFKKGLMAWRFKDEESDKHTVWQVTKVRPNRIDLAPKA